MTRIIRKQSDIAKDKTIIRCVQGDNVQREGVLSLKQEIQLLERSGKLLSQSIDKNIKNMEEEIKVERRFKEALDLIDEKRILDKAIKKNTDEINRMKQENKEILEMVEKQTKAETVQQTTQTNNV